MINSLILKQEQLSETPVILQCGDFRTLIKKVPDNSIDLILTDPSYSKRFLPLWENLAAESRRVLKPSGFLITYSGQLYLPQIMNTLSKQLRYYWLGTLYHKGRIERRFEVNMFNKGKLILFYQKEPYKKQSNWLEDVLYNKEPNGKFHRWGQDIQPFKLLIEKFTNIGDTVLDPLAGGGTVIEAVVSLKRNAIGFEINEKAYKQIKRRLKNLHN